MADKQSSFKVGDIVQLKSGGPKMTVSDVAPEFLTTREISCKWFAGAKLESGLFDPSTLIRVEDDNKK